MAVATLAAALAAEMALAEEPFDFQVDRFSVDGNVFGPPGGQPDLVDEFDGNALSGWAVYLGTASVHGGALHLTSPGTLAHDAFGALPGTDLDISMVYGTSPVVDGGGDFTATSVWEPTPLRRGDFNHFSLFAYRSPTDPFSQFEVTGLAITNRTPEGAPTQYQVVQYVVRFVDGAFAPLRLAEDPVDPASISGQIVFQLAFDDIANSVQTSYSVDGGRTFRTPFPAVPFFHGTTSGVFLLGSDPAATGAAAAPLACIGGTRLARGTLLVDASRHRATLDGRIPRAPFADGSFVPARDGAQILVRNQQAGDRPLLDFTGAGGIPAGGPGSGCGARDGWRRRGTTWTYRNSTDALPPACKPGSAHGIRTVRFTDRVAKRGWLDFGMTIRSTTLPALSEAIDTTIVLGGGDAAAASGACATAEAQCVFDGPVTRCR